MRDLAESLRGWAAERGYRVAWGPVELVRRVQQEIRKRHDDAELDERLFHEELEPITLARGNDEGMIVLVATPRPALRVRFDLGSRAVDALLPPTYDRYRQVFEDVRQDLVARGLPGTRVEHITAPLKALAAALGLVRYGRNNVTYAPGLGSYLQLCGYWTDAALPAFSSDAAVGPALLNECEGCDRCLTVCPTGAISADRVLIRAQRCLTFVNENPGEWPEWLPPHAHHCLLGCLLCQRVCPANPRLPIQDSGLCFDAGETRALLDGAAAPESRESAVRYKLAWLGQPYAEPVLGRNLRALLSRSGSAARGDQVPSCSSVAREDSGPRT